MPYEEWRLDGDPNAEECDPRDYEDPEACKVTLIECRDLAKPLLVTYMAKVDIFDEQVKEEFLPGRFSWDLHTAISRDDGTTWKRMNVSRMADMSSFDLDDRRGLPGHCRITLPEGQRQQDPDGMGEQVLQERQPALLHQHL